MSCNRVLRDRLRHSHLSSLRIMFPLGWLLAIAIQEGRAARRSNRIILFGPKTIYGMFCVTQLHAGTLSEPSGLCSFISYASGRSQWIRSAALFVNAKGSHNPDGGRVTFVQDPCGCQRWHFQQGLLEWQHLQQQQQQQQQ